MHRLLLLCVLCSGIAKIYVYSPDSLRLEMEKRYSHGEIRSSLVNFGNPPYRSIIVGHVYYRASQSNACESMNPFDWTDDPSQTSYPILLVNKGSCSFSIKAKNAQDVGAKALVVVNDIDENPEKVTMLSGSAGNISIPTFLISKSDGELMQKYINNSTYTSQVAISLNFVMTQNGNKINYDLYYSSEFLRFYDFLRDFAPIASEIKKEHATFKPHYVTSQCGWCRAVFWNANEINCVSGGRYCIEPPESSDNTGRYFLYENLREICIYKETENEDSYALWFNYIKYFSEICKGHITGECVNEAMNKASISIDKINLCIKESFREGDPRKVDNYLLSSERDFWESVSPPFYPSLAVNNQYYRGDWETGAVVKALCSGYSFGQEPEFCKGSSPDKEDKEKEKKDKEEKDKEGKDEEDKAEEDKAEEDKAKEDKENKDKEDKDKEDKEDKENKDKENKDIDADKNKTEGDKNKEDEDKNIDIDKDKDEDKKSIEAGAIVLILTLCGALISIIFILCRMLIKRWANDGVRKQVDTKGIELYYVDKKNNNGERADVKV